MYLIMKKGVLIIALGHPYYGKMAAALAATIRAADTQINIHLAWADRALAHLEPEEIKLFTTLAEITPDYYTNKKGERQWIRAKMGIYDLSPYDETLFLDCDVLWLRGSPADYMKEMEPYQVTFPNNGTGDTLWAKKAEIISQYGPGQYYNIHSELIYFKKGVKAKRWFDKALEIYDDIKVEHIVFADAIPDELPFSIAGALTGTYPHQDKHRPIFWGKIDRKEWGFKQVYEIQEKFWGVSMAGNNSTNYEILVYNIISKAAYYKLNLEKPYLWKQKRTFLPERKTY
jgi:hypothetical protein